MQGSGYPPMNLSTTCLVRLTHCIARISASQAIWRESTTFQLGVGDEQQKKRQVRCGWPQNPPLYRSSDELSLGACRQQRRNPGKQGQPDRGSPNLTSLEPDWQTQTPDFPKLRSRCPAPCCTERVPSLKESTDCQTPGWWRPYRPMLKRHPISFYHEQYNLVNVRTAPQDG